jgi:acetyl esterase
VAYRLAPEFAFPAAVDDAIASTAWVGDRLDTFGDTDRLALAGDSAGGTLAAVVAQQWQTRGGPALSAQLLAYPVADAGGAYASRVDNASGYSLEQLTMEWFWDHYIPDASRRLDERASPVHREDLAGLPPTVLVTAEFDVLRDEGAAYANRLRRAGVEVRYQCYPGLIHGFF